MNIEPDLDKAALLAHLGRAYGLALERLEFIPVGMVWAYRAHGAPQDYFVKIFPNTRTGLEALARLPGEIELLSALRAARVLERVPMVVPSVTGATTSSFQGQTLVVHRFIPGETLWGRLAEVTVPLATSIGRLHAGTARLGSVLEHLSVPPEDFALPFEAELFAGLARLESLPATARAGEKGLRALLWPRRAELLTLLERARGFQALVRAKPRNLVLCHTDAHGGNLMRDPGGELWLLDWEMARLAPPEHDLWMYHENLAEFLPPYATALGHPAELDPDLFGFYLYRRNLEDIAVWVMQLLDDPAGDAEDAHRLTELERWGLGWWDSLETDLAGIRSVLQK